MRRQVFSPQTPPVAEGWLAAAEEGAGEPVGAAEGAPDTEAEGAADGASVATGGEAVTAEEVGKGAPGSAPDELHPAAKTAPTKTWRHFTQRTLAETTEAISFLTGPSGGLFHPGACSRKATRLRRSPKIRTRAKR